MLVAGAVVAVALLLPMAVLGADGAVVQAAIVASAGASVGLLEDPAAAGPLLLLLVAGGLATLGLLSRPRPFGHVSTHPTALPPARSARNRREP
ncbi:MAG: hypothetical protein WCK58_17460 [Chloroflexota bacterium]